MRFTDISLYIAKDFMRWLYWSYRYKKVHVTNFSILEEKRVIKSLIKGLQLLKPKLG